MRMIKMIQGRRIILMAIAALLAISTVARADSLASILHDFETHNSQVGGRGASIGPGSRPWPDVSPAGVAAHKAELVKFQDRLKAISDTGLTDEEIITRKLLARNIAFALEGMSFDEERIPFTGGEGFYTRPNGMARNMIIHNQAEADFWIARLTALPDFYAQNIANMRRGLATNFTQPRITVQVALSTAKVIAEIPAEDDPLLAPFKKLPATISPQFQALLRAKALDVMKTKVKPAQADVVAFFQNEYLPKSRTSIGAHDMQDGDKYYAFLVRKYTTTDMTPDQVHQLGLDEVKRIQGEMVAAIADIGFKGSVKEFLAYLPTLAEYRAKSNDDYMEKASEILKRIDHELPRWFVTLPRLTYGIQIKSIDQANSSGGYYGGNPQLGIAGTIMPGRNLTGSPLYNLPSWLLHEGVPGHHIQIALGQERTDLPAFRRSDGLTAFVEGWALYSERLGGEMGIYRNKYEEFGRLSFEIWRACRLVIDTGMHVKGWTRDQAVACLTDNTSLSARSINNEVDRYIGWPGQALAYKIGELKISELRARAEKELGPNFDIRKFHDAVIDDGPLPLAILDDQINKWIAAQKATIKAQNQDIPLTTRTGDDETAY